MSEIVLPRRAYHELPIAYAVGGALVFELPKKLESPNRLIWRPGSRFGLSRERKQFEGLLVAALCRYHGVLSRHALERHPAAVVRRRADVVREVPSARQFIRDDDNLAFSAKPLYDALKHARLIVDDQRTWLEIAPVVQRVAPDGRARTIVRLTEV